MTIPFFKYQGTGNDFVIIDQRQQQYLTGSDQAIIEKMCDRRFGIGADGLMLIEKSTEADFDMIYFNADGRTSSMCGNGGRCIASLAARLGMYKDQCTFMAIDGLHEAKLVEDQVIALKMNDVSSISRDDQAYVLDTGSPHYVSFATAISDLDMVNVGQSIRYNDTYKDKGINVNIAESTTEQLLVRTYERGVEDETFSCGTGVVAASIAHAIHTNQVEQEIKISTKGGHLKVSWTKGDDGTFRDIWLTGPATFVYEGDYNI